MTQEQQPLLERILTQQQSTLETLQSLQSAWAQGPDTKSILTDLLILYDQLQSIQAQFPEQQNPPENSAILSIYANQKKRSQDQLQALQTLQQSMLDILLKHDIHPISPPAVGSPLDPHCHRVISSRPGKQAQDRLICKVLREGFYHHEQVLRPIDVIIYQFQEEDTP